MSKKFTRDDLKTFIRDMKFPEGTKLIKEYNYTNQVNNVRNPLLSFAVAYNSLDSSVLTEVNTIVLAAEEFMTNSQEFVDAVMQSNPHAVREAYGKLKDTLEVMRAGSGDALILLETLEAATDIIARDGSY